MIKFVTTLFATLFLFGAPQICMGDYEDVFPEMQNEDQLDAQTQAQAHVREEESQAPHSCPNCCKRKRWKKDRFLENQYRETGWPGRRDELSDQLSR
ncbi:MAG: hypothetical protein H0W50_07715 [Parachlamydiaceae bacterium]|nr:hypothetical protein [Parachlamydiaceae bacterium]